MKAATIDIAHEMRRAQSAETSGKWLDAMTAYQAVLHLPDLDSEQRAIVERKIGILQFNRGELDSAAEWLNRSFETAELANASAGMASALNCLATVKQAQGKLSEAENLYARASVYAENAGHGRLSVMIDQNMGTIASIRGDTDAALKRYGSALTRYREMQDLQGATWVLNNLGMVHAAADNFELAEENFEGALQLSEQRQDIDMVGTVHLNRADLFMRRRDFDTARHNADQAFEIFTRIDSKIGIAEVSKLYGMLYREIGKLQLADSYLSVVIDIAKKSDFMLLQAEAEAEYALVHQAAGRSREALRSLNASHRLFTDLQAQRKLVDIERQLDKLEKKYLLVTQVWGESIESKDHYTAGHCKRVADYACRIAENVGFRGRDLTWIRMGGFLHDVGKTAVDSAILNKAGKLDANEWEAMKRHTVVGDNIVADMDFPWDIRPMVRNHHERWDGTGYPDRLVGNDIPLTARILCVADVFDALTTARSYRPAHTPESALHVMREEAGTTLDPELFEVFEKEVWSPEGFRR